MSNSSTRPYLQPSTPHGEAVRRVLGIYAVVCLGLWVVPLLNRLHAESSAVLAAVAFFGAGLTSLVAFRQGGRLGRVLAAQLAALALPWGLMTVAVLWAPNCGYGQGFLFFLLFVPPSATLGVALAFALSARRRPATAFVVLGVAVMALGPLYDLGLHPQFYTYNHVFGGVLGPIYDEELVIRPGLVVFRAMTLLWAALAVLVGWRLRLSAWPAAQRAARRSRLLAGAGATALVLGLAYAMAVPLGVNTAAWYLRAELGGHLATEHFDVYFDPEAVGDVELQQLAEDHEFRYAQLAARLGVEVPERIASYLYPDAATKAQLTGARTTNVAPVWLRRPQVHVLQTAYERVFPHELAHVFSREFGLPVLRASTAVGLVEGLAVALEPPDGGPTPHEQVAAALGQRLGPARGGLAGDVAARLSPQGFWSGRGAVSYTTLGSFVRYLLDAYGPAPLRQAYATADFAGAYGKPVAVLAAEWEAYLRALPVLDRDAGGLVARRFAVPSLFERRCPHHVPRPVRRTREAAAALADGETARAEARLAEALAEAPGYVPARALQAHLKLAAGRPEAVVAALDTVAAVRLVPALALPLADALALEGRLTEAHARYDAVLGALPASAHEARLAVAMRRALAADVRALGVLTSGAPDSTRARRLLALGAAPAEARLLGALLLLQADRYEEAAAALRVAPVPEGPVWTPARRRTLAAQRLAWEATALYGARRLGDARRRAHAAAEAFRTAGALNTAEALGDVEARLSWLIDAGRAEGASRLRPPKRRSPRNRAAAARYQQPATPGARARASGTQHVVR